MSANQKSESDPRAFLAIVAAIICGIAGYDAGEWGGAIVAAIAAFGGVYLLFAAIVLSIKVAIGGAILVVMLLALQSRAEFLLDFFQS